MPLLDPAPDSLQHRTSMVLPCKPRAIFESARFFAVGIVRRDDEGVTIGKNRRERRSDAGTFYKS
jgi:hypothetical protein